MPTPTNHRNALPIGYHLQEYRLESLLGHGGFGMTYLAHDTQLDAQVAIKEYLPNEIAVREGDYTVQPKSEQDADVFAWGLERFLQEARILAKLNHPSIVRVRRYFPAHHTAYIVMDYEQGQSLDSALKGGETATEAELMHLLPPLLAGLKRVHDAGYLHRDIKPANIYLRDKNRSPLLIDFGAARYAVMRSRSMTAIVTPGYSPFEQYQSEGEQGAWTDIYAFGAVLYRTIGGSTPAEATTRIAARLDNQPDPLTPAVDVGRGRYSERLLQAIDWALQTQVADRPQNVLEWARARPFSRQSQNSKASDSTKRFSSRDLPPPPPTQSKPSYPIKRAALVGLAVVVVVIGLSVVYAQWQTWREQQQAGTQKTLEEQQLADLQQQQAAAEKARETEEQRLKELQRQQQAAKQRLAQLQQQEAARKEAERLRNAWTPGKTFRDSLPNGGLGPKMVVIPAGRFQMGDIQGGGSSDEQPVHWVSVNQFAMGTHEVTVGEYLRFVRATGSHAPHWLERGSKYNIQTGTSNYYKKLGSALTNENHPIVGISWNDATAYADWLSQQTGHQYRLPTEAEWEYAARAGTTTKYWWGNGIGSNRANCDGCGSPWDDKQPAPVGSFLANPFGLYDTVGNVREWVADNSHSNYQGAPTDGSAWKKSSKYRVLRGGSFSNVPDVSRAANRYGGTSDNRFNYLGFRVAVGPVAWTN